MAEGNPGFDPERCLLCTQQLWTLQANTSAYERFHREAHKSLESLLNLQTREYERRLEGLNELRQQVIDDREEFARRDVLEIRLQVLEKSTQQGGARVSNIEGTIKGITLGLSLTVLASLAAVVLAIIKG